MRLVALSLALAGLVLWLILQSTYGRVARGLDSNQEQIPRARTSQPADLAAPRGTPQDEISPGKASEPAAEPKRVARQDPWRLRFIHAGDKTPLRGVDVRIAGTEQALSTEADGSCTLPKVPAGSTDLWIDLNGDGTHERTLTVAAPEAEHVFELDDIYTFEIIQSPENAARYPAEWLAVVRRSDSRAYAPNRHTLTRSPKDSAMAWCHVDMDSIPWLMQLDVVVANDQARARRPLLFVAGLQRTAVHLAGLVEVQLRIVASGLLDPQVSIYVVQGQQLDLKDTQRSSPDPLTIQWNHVREGKYRITIDSLSHDRWEGEFDAAPPFTPIDAVLVQGPTMRLHGAIALREGAGSAADDQAAIRLRVSRDQPVQEEFHLDLGGSAIESVDDSTVLRFDFPRIRQGTWSVEPQVLTDGDQLFEPVGLTVDPENSAQALHFSH